MLLSWLGRLPLSALQGIGRAAGSLAWALSPRLRRDMRANAGGSGLAGADLDAFCRRAAREMGCALLEVPAFWFAPLDRVRAWVSPDPAFERIREAASRRPGPILLTPHLGAFEVTSLYAGGVFPITAMYRRPRVAWFEPAMRAGRERGGVRLVPADVTGVRALLRALKRGEAIGLLPDQAPERGEGAWASFFGRPAWTMTLVARLQRATGAPVFFVVARRLPRAQGFRLEVSHLEQPLPDEPEAATRALNARIEALIADCPEQYLWAYNRHKVPPGVERPPEARAGMAG